MKHCHAEDRGAGCPLSVMPDTFAAAENRASLQTFAVQSIACDAPGWSVRRPPGSEGHSDLRAMWTAFPFSHYPVLFLPNNGIRLCCRQSDGRFPEVAAGIFLPGGIRGRGIQEFPFKENGVVVTAPRQPGFAGPAAEIPAQSVRRETCITGNEGEEATP